MAKAKKKETLMPEERLRAALVPNWEQPYKVPENWCWIRLTSLKNGDSGFFDGDWILSENMDPTGDIRLLQLSDIGIGEFLNKSNKHINEKSFKELACSELNEGDIMISRMAEPIARSCIVPKFPYKVITAVDVAVLRCNSHLVINQYINYICNTKWFTDLAFSLARGTTRVRITRKNLGEMPIPLPPLPEQQRIVDRIESLFAKLDEAKQKAQDALDSFETRKAAILHKAFTGELTTRWRKEHGVGMESWKNRTLSQLAKQIKAGGDKPDDFTETADKIRNIPVVANGITNEGIVGYTSTVRFSGETITVAGRGTIGFSIYRTYPFFPIVRLIVIEPKDIVKAPYIKYAFDAFPENGTGSSIPQLTVPMVKEKIIPLPKLNEQTEIVRILDDLLAKEQRSKEAAEAVLEQVDLIKKSILARAFRGELGTNDPAEESAVELVRNMI